ncbi:MAG TPA: hypothetical protein VFP68_07695, partial [Burkholderiaceae bacterium]|nr:hypothetical protein [Burkholderiaceae bacterium]
VEGVRGVRVKGKGSGVGAVTGGVLGGLLGSNIGKGNGRSAMTALGIVGGGIAGHEVEKRMKARTVYEVRVRMDDGRVRMFTRNTRPALGSRVVVEGNRLRSASGRRPVDDDARYVDRKV